MTGIIGTITTHESAVGFVVEWHIPRFYTLKKTDDAFYSSPFFSFDGEEWVLGITTYGARARGTVGYVDLCLAQWASGPSIRLPGLKTSLSLEVSLSLKTAKGKKCREELFTKDFGGDDSILEFNRVISRPKLCRLKSKLVPNNVLTIVCTMKRSTSAGNEKGEASNAEVKKSSMAEASGSSQAGTTTTEESEGEASNVGVNKSDVTEASGSSQAGTATTKESILKWIKENCKVASKGKKRKTETENVLKWIEDNCKKTFKGKKRKMEEKKAVGKLLQDLKEIMVNGDLSDITISVRGEEFRLHRSILGVRNPFFHSTFSAVKQETTPETLSIDNCDPDQFRTLIHYIYTGTADNLCPENVCGLYEVAVVYQEQQMKTECLHLLMNTLSIENFCDYFSLALKHDLKELLQKATELFVSKVNEITRHEKWKSIMEKYPEQAHKLYMKALEQKDEK